MRKAQITLFIIVGIVILFVLAFSIYLLSTIQKPFVSVDATPSNDAQTCLEQVSEQALIDLLSYAGTPSTTAEANNEHISIGAGERVATAAYVKYTEDQNNILTKVYYGTYQLEPLCLRDGPNKPNVALDNTNTCMTGTYQLFESDNEVWQYQLQQAVERGLVQANCTEKGSVSVLIGGDDITIRTENVSVRTPVRLKRMYNAAYVFIKEETTNLDFNLNTVTTLTGCTEPYKGNNCLLDGIQVTTYTTTEYVFVNITDKASMLRGQPATLRFAVQNRPPVIKESLVMPPAPAQPVQSIYTYKYFGLPPVAPHSYTRTVPVKDPDDTPVEASCRLFDPQDPDKYTTTQSPWLRCEALSPTQIKVDITPVCREPYEAALDSMLSNGPLPFIVEVSRGTAKNNLTGELVGPLDKCACDVKCACDTWGPGPEPINDCDARFDDDTPEFDNCESTYKEARDRWEIQRTTCEETYNS